MCKSILAELIKCSSSEIYKMLFGAKVCKFRDFVNLLTEIFENLQQKSMVRSWRIVLLLMSSALGKASIKKI